MMNIVYIHGNGASSESFNFIRSQLSGHNEILLEYDSAKGFYNNFQEMLAQLQDIDEMFFVAHSLGGIYALHLANELPDRVLGAVTLSTPYGGSEAARLMQYVLPFNQVIRDIQPHSGPIAQGHQCKVVQPWTNVISIKGHSSFMAAANDGVVTHDSMRYRDDIALVELDSNHYEILLSHDVVSLIRKEIKRVEHKVAHDIYAYA